MSWQPSASLATARARAQLLQQIRNFFQQRDVLEVETPLLCTHTVTDPYIDSFQTTDGRFLQTSPEYAMKRLLAAGYGSIFQICKAFRLEEAGQQHNPEFTMLEWYRVGFSMRNLMQEVGELLHLLLPELSVLEFTYEQLFTRYANINPHTAAESDLQQLLLHHQIDIPTELNRDDYLHLIMSSIIEPLLPNAIVFVAHFPPSQAALAKLDNQAPHHALRFEVYVNGIELANGFEELQDAAEQKQRFVTNNQQRTTENKHNVAIDNYFIAALEAGLPACSGVALGVDRLLQLITKDAHIEHTLTFAWGNS